MKSLRSLIFLGALFWLTFKVFESAIAMRPQGEEWDIAYFVGAATVDWMMYRLTPQFVEGKLCRDIEALCIASMLAHAIGFALYMAYSPPYFHNLTIRGLNYALAFKLIFTGGSNVLTNFDWRGLVRGPAIRCMGYQNKEAQH